MKTFQKKLVVEQLSSTLNCFKILKTIIPPPKGWIRAIRDALGINGRQFAQRLEVNKSRITRIEHDEVTGNVTLRTMLRAAEALDCVFVYGLVPKTSLQDTIKKQANLVAKKQMMRVSHTMLLEDQGLSEKEKKKAFDNTVEELVQTMPKSLWDVK
ncbi:MAG: mobile mystery protein A [Candidatus Desulfaltia sp.]|nr:mobile mystery protein A [Candidatus Desulfaltia sp.]